MLWIFGEGTTLGLFGAFLVCMEVGRVVGRRRAARLGKQALEGLGTVEGALLALLGLLLAFTFSAAASRFDRRRDLIVDEANAIGTAYLRIDLLPEQAHARLRRTFGQYLDARLAVYHTLRPFQAQTEELARVAALQSDIWRQTVAATMASDRPQVTTVVIPATNQMFDAASTRTVAQHTHVPGVIVGLLVALSLAASVLAGYGLAGSERRSWTHILVFAALLAGTLHVIIDYEFPRFGHIRLTDAEQVLVDLRATMP